MPSSDVSKRYQKIFEKGDCFPIGQAYDNMNFPGLPGARSAAGPESSGLSAEDKYQEAIMKSVSNPLGRRDPFQRLSMFRS